MKSLKMLAAAFLVLATGTLLADGDVDYGMFKDIPSGIGNKSVVGVRFGLPCAISSGIVEGAELSLCYSATQKVYGFKYALLGVNAGKELEGAALAFVNVTEGELDGVQIGLYNHSGKDGVQIGLINICDNDAEFQFGLLNFNPRGWLPVMPFVNFSSDIAD